MSSLCLNRCCILKVSRTVFCWVLYVFLCTGVAFSKSLVQIYTYQNPGNVGHHLEVSIHSCDL